MNPRQAAFVMAECDRLDRVNRADGMFVPPSPAQMRELCKRAEALEYPWVRLWHRIKAPEWERLYPEAGP